MRILTRCVLAGLLLILCGTSLTAVAGPRYTLKFATLVPQGTVWMNVLEDWGREVAERSNGELVFKFYPGGVQGDEPDVIKKMRFGQLQGGAFTGYGVGLIHPPARILEMPFLFTDHAEIDEVRARYMPEFEQGFRDSGYELLGWSEIGFIHFFSKHPLTSLDDLKQQRIWLWQGDQLGEAWFHAAGVSPIPLSITDVYTSLSTGLIDTVYCTPLATVALQWFTKTAYMTNVPMANGIGVLLVSRRFFGKLPPHLKQLLHETGRATGERLIAMTREDNQKSIEILQQEGIKLVLNRADIDQAELEQLSERAAARLTASGYIPRPLFDRTRALLAEIRAREPSGKPRQQD